MSALLSDLATRLGGTLHGENKPFHDFALDSRDVKPGLVFLAIRGARHDGHEFVSVAQESGAVACVVERPVEGTHILVDNLVEALALYGRSIRAEFKGPVVGITGSNGKTTAKEMTAAALSPLGPILKNVGNQNSEFTSPLVWHKLTPEHRAAVIEMGMRGFHQIDHLASISQPNLGLITMIGTAHIEMVGSRQGIAQAKGELFRALPPEGIAHCWAEDDFLPFLKDQAPCAVRTFGFGPDADLRVLGYRALDLNQSEVRVELHGERVTFTLPTIGRHQALNAAAALLVAHSAGVPLMTAAEAIESVQLPPMRMEIQPLGPAQALLDTYNASPDSMVAALKTLAELPCAGRRLAVLGEMKELGVVSELGHRQVGKEVAHSSLDGLVLFGGETRFIQDEAVQHGFPADRISVATSLQDVRAFLAQVQEGDLVLIKGSRALGLERALEAQS